MNHPRLLLCMFLGGSLAACGGGPADPDGAARDARSADAAADPDASREAGTAADAGRPSEADTSVDATAFADASVDTGTGGDGGGAADTGAPGDAAVVRSELPALVGVAPPVASGAAATVAVFGTNLTSSCALQLVLGPRTTPIPTVYINANMVTAMLPAAATDGLRGYGTLRMTGCPEATAPFPIHIGAPATGWSGSVVSELAPPSGSVGTEVAVSGDLVAGARIEVPGTTPLALVAGRFTVPSGFASGPLPIGVAGGSQTYVTFPFHTRTNLARTATITASSTYAGYPVSRVVDDSMATGWFPATGNCTSTGCAMPDVWVQLDWSTAQTIETVVLREDVREGNGYRIRELEIEVFETPAGPGSVFVHQQRFLLPTPETNADLVFAPPLSRVRALRIRILRDDSRELGLGRTGSIGELMVLAP